MGRSEIIADLKTEFMQRYSLDEIKDSKELATLWQSLVAGKFDKKLITKYLKLK